MGLEPRSVPSLGCDSGVEEAGPLLGRVPRAWLSEGMTKATTALTKSCSPLWKPQGWSDQRAPHAGTWWIGATKRGAGRGFQVLTSQLQSIIDVYI